MRRQISLTTRNLLMALGFHANSIPVSHAKLQRRLPGIFRAYLESDYIQRPSDIHTVGTQ